MRRMQAVARDGLPRGPRAGLVTIVVVACLVLVTDGVFTTFTAFPSRPHMHVLHYWLLLILGMAYVSWSVLQQRRLIAPAGEPAFGLSAFGLFAWYYCHFLLFGLGSSYGSTSLAEQTADGNLRFLIAAHRWGGLLAYVVGLTLVVIGSIAATGGYGPPSRPQGANVE